MKKKMLSRKNLTKFDRKFDSKGYVVLRNGIKDIYKIYFTNLFFFESKKTEIYFSRLFIFFKIIYNMYVYTNSVARLEKTYIQNESNTFKDAFSKSHEKQTFLIKSRFELDSVKNTKAGSEYTNLFYTDAFVKFNCDESIQDSTEYLEELNTPYSFYNEYVYTYNFNKK